MTPKLHDQICVDRFFATVEPMRLGYRDNTLSYLAVKSGERFEIVQARLFLNPVAPKGSFSHFQSENVRVGRYASSDLDLDARNLIQRFATGKIATPHGDLHFPSDDDGTYRVYHIPFHQEGLRTQSRMNVLGLRGKLQHLIRQPDLDWEIKAASQPYDGLHELALEYGLHPIASDGPANLEVIALGVAAIDTQTSTVVGEQATVRIVLSVGLDPNQLKLGYRIFSQGRVSKRAAIDGSELAWTLEEGIRRGEAVITIPKAAVLNCVVSYCGMAQHHWWLTDPSTVQNPRRAIYEVFDKQMENLRDILAKAQGKGPEARNFESAVAWLLWMLGFSVAHLGGTPRTQDAADLVATAPNGQFAMIECTTGLLKAENKLALLYERAESARRALAASNQQHLRVLPAIVTTKSRDDIKAELEQAEKLGVLVVTSEDILQIIERTILLPNADQVYEESEKSVRSAQAKHASAHNSPFAKG